jgi:hypothetical protein
VSKISEADKQALPLGWWETVIKHYYRLGYSEDETVRVVLETMKR